MEPQDFSDILPSIWLVFADTYLTHKNALCKQPDKREKFLVDLLVSYLKFELKNFSVKQLYNEPIRTQLVSVRNLLELWSQDLGLIYEAKESGDNLEVCVRQIARRFLQRIQTFDNCTIIPNGLISAGTESPDDSHENVCCAILKKQINRIDWIQVDPGSAYHQRCQSLAGDKSNAYLEITEIDFDNITEDWLYLLVGLKAIQPGDKFFYKEVSLYECLLVHLNGKTAFQSQPGEEFIEYSHTSPAHTWQVVSHSFHYLLRHFLGETHHEMYRRLLTGFKLFLMEKTFVAYQDKDNKQLEQCHFLLQEMCRCLALQSLEHGNEEQKQYSLKLIQEVKAAIEQRCIQQELLSCQLSKLNEIHINSLSFEALRLNSHNQSSNDLTVPNLKADPAFIKPSIQDDTIEYQ